MSPFHNPITIIIADDHPFYREGLLNVLNSTGRYNVVAEASNGQELIELALEHEPDILIVDIGMPILNGIEAVKKITALGLVCRSIALSMHSEDSVMLQILNAGAMGYLDKNTSKEELFEAIDSVVIHDRVYFPASTNTHMMELLSTSDYKPYPEPVIEFSDRELEVIVLVCRDFNSKEIADKLNLGHRTIETHRARIMERMNVKSVAGLVAYAYSNKIISVF
jgi:DNA-binding NarL/FixJ family response regulator